MSRFIYRNIFLYSSLQFDGNIEPYFVRHTKKLLSFILMPRVKNNGNYVRIYEMGKLAREEKFLLPQNIILYYVFWYIKQVRCLLKYFSSKEKVIMITFHPLPLFAKTIQKIFRNIEYAYWIGDYFPPVNFQLRLFEKLKRYYHGKVQYNFYLSSTINRMMNGRVVDRSKKRTVMWGIKTNFRPKQINTGTFNLLFVGLIKHGQGLEEIFSFLTEHKGYHLSIIGICPDDLYTYYQSVIHRYKISDKVFFPNKFYGDKELKRIANSCHVGIALYDVSRLSATWYTDPGKIKTYAELGLPIIMSNTSAIRDYVRKFKCGEIITDTNKLEDAIVKIQRHYSEYRRGLAKFESYFNYEKYYKKSFTSLEIK